jgi:hypothetical protein
MALVDSSSPGSILKAQKSDKVNSTNCALVEQFAWIDGVSLGNAKETSNLPKYTLVDDLPASVISATAIEFFYLKDQDSKRDLLRAIIEFRNFKSRPEALMECSRAHSHGCQTTHHHQAQILPELRVLCIAPMLYDAHSPQQPAAHNSQNLVHD